MSPVQAHDGPFASKVEIGTTGPKVSSRESRISGMTLAMIVGSKSGLRIADAGAPATDDQAGAVRHRTAMCSSTFAARRAL